jgi:pyruvate/2-oxoglutarate dehydrogenase complex dihydrolipoamide dehydrogenase (E3) component
MSPAVRVPPDDQYNAQLVENVHPAAYVNPEPAPCYNLVVIGAGAAGLVTAAGAAGLGARVALVERYLLGGDCLNVGCVPSKALVRAARAAQDAGAFGIEVPPGTTVDFPRVMERLRRLRAEISANDSVSRFRALGVDVFLGDGRFTGKDSVQVDGKALRFVNAVIATGARARVPDVPGLAEAGYFTNESIFTLTELPRRLAVVGGGPIGCELAQAFGRLGSAVTIIHSHTHLVPKEDRAAADCVRAALESEGVRLYLDAKLQRVERRGAERVLTVEGVTGLSEVVADAILIGAGRSPNVHGMGLETVGVQYQARGVTVDDRLRTTNPRIYAAGDICSSYQFTHAADAMARIVIQNALFPGWTSFSSLTIPRCTYTDPEVAAVGLTERDAAAAGVAIDSFRQPLSGVDRAVIDGETAGFAVVHVAAGTDRIVGGTVVARHAGEMISALTQAMVTGAGLKAFGRTVHPYPIQAEALKKCGDSWNRTRLTPLMKSLIGLYLRWMRR